MKTIEIDPFDSDSIDAAIKALNKFAKERERKIDLYVQKLAQVGEVAAQRAFGGSVSVKAHKDGKGRWEIRADGKQVVFLEFGTGELVEDHELSKPLRIEISPGSWSESKYGMHTWSEWLENSGRYEGNGITVRDYPYNTRPRAGMWEAYKAIVAAQDRIANEVFGK